MSEDSVAVKPGRDRSLIVVLSIIGALVVIALVVVFSRQDPPLRDENTPEGVVQRYSAAVIDGDEEAAAQYLSRGSDTTDAGCDPFADPTTQDLRVTLVSTTERADTADVRVSIATMLDSGPFGPSSYETDDVFDLKRTNGAWLIVRAPWQLTVCPGSGEIK
ncbi:MAG: hypothetical protein ABWX59_09155 [Microbacteriaceae bacterium]